MSIASNKDILTELRKIIDIPKNLTELHLHLVADHTPTIETVEIVRTPRKFGARELRKIWKLEEV